MLPLLKSKRPAIFLAAIVLCAAALSMYWVFLVPIYEAPDEQTHLDYVFNIYSAGRPINVREPYHGWNFGPLSQHGEKLGNVYHVYTIYLIQVSDLNKIAFNPVAKAPINYGTRSFYRDLDLHALQKCLEISKASGSSAHRVGEHRSKRVAPMEVTTEDLVSAAERIVYAPCLSPSGIPSLSGNLPII